jgi:hypothetical protein
MAKKKKPSDILNEEAFGNIAGQGASLFGDDTEKAKEFLTTPYVPLEKPKVKTEGEKRQEAQELWEKTYGEKAEEPEIPEPAADQRPLTEEQAIDAEEYKAPEPEVEEPAEEPEAVADQVEEQTKQGIETLKDVSFPDMADLALQNNQIRQEYLNELAEAKETYARTKDEVAQKRIWEALINGVAALATAWYGSNTGLDLSGVKFSPSDWDSKLDQARQDLAVAKSLAKDVRDVKLEGTEEESTRRLREMQANKAFNDSVYERLSYDMRVKQYEARNAAKASDEAATQQQDVLEQVKDKGAFARYKDEKKKLEAALEKYKEEPDDKLLDEIRTHSNIMQSMSDQLTKTLDGAVFPNEYPPNIFESKESAGLFGLWKSTEEPEYQDILERRAASLETQMSPEHIAIYKEMLKTPDKDPNKYRAAVYLQQIYPNLFSGGE